MPPGPATPFISTILRPLYPFCGSSHPEAMDVNSGRVGVTRRHQEELLPMDPLGMDSAEQPLVEEKRIVEHLFVRVYHLRG